MEKITMGPYPFLYPMPTVIVGTLIEGKPNFITVSYCGIIQHKPAMISIALIDRHYTNRGIKENGCFSVNIPNTRMLEVTDYLGINSGSVIDKSGLFDVFYGKLPNAPMIRETPLNMECTVVKSIDLGNDCEIYIGEIVESYTEKKYLKNGRPYIRKLDPILFSINSNNYFRVGRRLGPAWRSGLNFKPK
jgi:flavin reductase (DIM6/NTAB) family NADH-FMN oxidoreductase RutF